MKTVSGLPGARGLQWLALALLLGGLGLTLLLARELHLDALRQERAVQAIEADEALRKLEERLGRHALVLEGAAALFQASGEVSREEWRRYVDRLGLERNLRGMQALGFTVWVPRERLPALLAAARRELPGYRSAPLRAGDAHALVYFIEPMQGRNLRALGYDNFADPVRRALLESARDEGRTRMSGVIRLLQEDGTDEQPGVLVFTPVYRPGPTPVTVAERRAALQGWVFATFRMRDFMSDVFRAWQADFGGGLDLSVYAGRVIRADALVFRDGPRRGGAAAGGFADVRRVRFAGQDWTLVFARGPGLAATDRADVGMTLAAGGVISLLLASLVLVIGRIRQAAARMAQRMTADIIAGQEKLKDSEYRSKFALEGADLGVWDRDLEGGRVLFSRRWREILGFGDGEPGQRIEDWLALVHADDRAPLQAQVDAVLERGETLYQSEHRLRCADGRYKWVHDRGMVVERDARGRPRRMVGTIADIDARKRLELDRERYYRLFQLSLEPLCIMDTATVTLQAVNKGFTDLLGYTEDEMAGRSPTDFMAPEDVAPTASAVRDFLVSGVLDALDNRYLTRDGRRVILSWRAFLDRDNGLMYWSARDVTEHRAAQHRVQRLDRLYAALSACNSAIVRCESEDELVREICHIVVRHGGLRMAWLGRIDRESRRVEVVHADGAGLDYLDGIEISVDADNPHGRGPTGTAGRENRPVWFEDLADNPAFAPWRDRAAKFGWRAAAALPVRRGGEPVAVLSLYADEAEFFDADIRKLLIEMSHDIGYAFDKFDAEAASARSRAELEESEQRFRALVEQGIAGAYIVQDGRLVYANPRLAAILGYDDFRELLERSPEVLAVPADRARMVANLRQLIEGEVPRLETLFTGVRKDGSLVEVSTHSSVATYRGRLAVIGLLQDMSDRQVAEDHVRHYAAKLESMLLGTVNMVTSISDLRDPYTAGHERRVAEIAAALGRELGLEESRIEGLRIAGLLHDVGNILIPAEILSKPGKLSETEFGIVQEHARAGHDVLKDIDFPWPVAAVALQHHERLDGSGYPQGLKGDAIVLEARIVAVADVVEAMASHRPYRPAIGVEAALAEIEQGAGTRYDAQVVAACLRLYRERGFQAAP